MKWIFTFLTLISFAAVAGDFKPAAFNDTVKKIREDDEGVVVIFDKVTGNFYLRRDLPQFDNFKKKLSDSVSSKKPVSVTPDKAGLNILEVK